MSGGEVVIGEGSLVHNFGLLHVDGDVDWTGRTYRPVVYGVQDEGPADMWYASGSFTIGGTATIAPSSVDFEYSETDPTDAYCWFVIRASGGITAANNTPSLPANYTLALGPNNPPEFLWIVWNGN